MKSVPISSVASFTTADRASSNNVFSGMVSRRTDLEERYHGIIVLLLLLLLLLCILLFPLLGAMMSLLPIVSFSLFNEYEGVVE